MMAQETYACQKYKQYVSDCEELVLITVPRINRPASTTHVVQFSVFRSNGQLFFK